MDKIEIPPDSGPYRYLNNCTVTVRRLDLADVIAGGNKWFKLQFNLVAARNSGANTLVTSGGAFSNHIAATARMGKKYNFNTVGIIRGDEISSGNNTLSRAMKDGMQLIFVTREAYRDKDELFREYYQDKKYFVIPEGGANKEGVRGCSEILSDDDKDFDFIIVACGTGTTAAGLAGKLRAHQKLIGFSVLNDHGFLDKVMDEYVKDPIQRDSITINRDFIFGGYAKITKQLLDFSRTYTIPVEPVYTGKMFYGLEELLKEGYFPQGSKILAIHTGGMQYLVNN